MALLTETTGTLASLVDDLATTLSGVTAWTDADASVVNDGSTEEPHKNGRVFSNTNTGTFLFFYVSHGEVDAAQNTSNKLAGVRIIHSTDWDANAHRPAGLTDTIRDRDYWRETEVNPASTSFVHFDPGWDQVLGTKYGEERTDELQKASLRAGRGAMVRQSTMASRTDARSFSATYFASARADGLTIAAWNTTDGTNGIASCYNYEWMDSKFYDDGEIPVVITYNDSGQDNSSQMNVVASYGFRTYSISQDTEHGAVGCNRGCVQPGKWGVLNPDANDDTFFFRRPTVYRNAGIGRFTSANQKNYLPRPKSPVGFIGDAIPNQPGQGVAHGDTITEGGNDYRGFVQSGAGRTNAIGAALRYE